MTKKREKLLGQILDFQAQAEKYLDQRDADKRPAEVFDTDWSEPEDTDPAGASHKRNVVVNANTRCLSLGQVENIRLLLPSRLGIETCRRVGLKSIANKEKALRKGQANDALHSLRMAIGHKSFLFRKRLRNAKSKVRKTKAWDDINTVGNTVTHHRRIYNIARRALVALGASKSTMNQYQPIASADTKSSTVIVDPNARGQRNKGLPWFWSVGTGSSKPLEGPLMTECQSNEI